MAAMLFTLRPLAGEGPGERALLLFGIPPYALMFRVAPPRAPHFSLLVQRKVSKRNTPRHPALPAAGYVHAIIAPGARREGPSLAHRGSRGIHAAQPLPQRFCSPSWRGIWRAP